MSAASQTDRFGGRGTLRHADQSDKMQQGGKTLTISWFCCLVEKHKKRKTHNKAEMIIYSQTLFSFFPACFIVPHQHVSEAITAVLSRTHVLVELTGCLSVSDRGPEVEGSGF